MYFIPPKGEWHRFETDEEAIEYAKSIEIVPKSCKKNRTFFYVDGKEIARCKIVGYVDEWTAVIDVNGNLDCILPEYFVDMQSIKNKQMKELTEYDILKADEYIALDFETTGFSPDDDEIIDIGAVKIRNGEEIACYSTLINPHCVVSNRIEKLTGITSVDLMEAPDLEDIADEFIAFLGNFPIIAHNAKFDIGFLCKKFCGSITSEVRYFDTLKYARERLPGIKDHKLSSLVNYYNLDCENTHRALDDARCLPKLLDALTNRFTGKKSKSAKAKKEDDEPAVATKEEVELFENLRPCIEQELSVRWMSPERVYLRPTKNDCSICLGKDDNVVAKIKARKDSRWFAISDNCIKAVPKSMTPDDVKMEGFIRFTFVEWDERFVDMFIHALRLYFENYITDFSCCSLYEECSAAMKCLHPDDMFYLSCSYRKKIFHGISFYGKKEKSPGQPGLGD